MSHRRLKVAVLVSGSGSNLQVMIDAMQAGTLPIDIIGVISNREDAYAITRANTANIPVAVLSHAPSGKRMSIATFEKHALAQIEAWSPDLVVLAGFMRILTPAFVAHYSGRLINIHPSLLPAFPGLHTHQRAIDAGCQVAGATVHQVTAELDHGPILAQAVVPILPGDDAAQLAARILTQEHLIYPRAVAQLLPHLSAG